MILKDGMVFKNYKELCEFMCWEATRGNTKKARLKELDSLCKWYKEGQKIYIELVYNYIKPKEDGRSKNNIYINPVEAILLFTLKDMDKPEVYFSNSKMYKILGMFNGNFEELNYGDTNSIVEELMVDYLTAKSFKISSKAEANRIIKRALKGMKNKKTIDYIEGRILVGNDGTHRVATADELRKLNLIEKEAMEEIGCMSYSQLEYKNLIYKYHKIVSEKRNELDIDNFEYSYDGYCVVGHNKIIAEEIDRQCKDKNFKILNDLFCKKLRATAETRHKSAIKKAESEVGFGQSILTGEASESYVKDYDKMIRTYVENSK